MDPSSEMLVSTLMAVIGTIWAVGFAAYTFIYQYFDKAHRQDAQRMERDVYFGIPVPKDRLQDMLNGLRGNFWVYMGFAIAGTLSFVTVASALSALYFGSEADVIRTIWLFVVALLFHVVLFTYELGTSMKQVGRLWWRIQQARGR